MWSKFLTCRSSIVGRDLASILSRRLAETDTGRLPASRRQGLPHGPHRRYFHRLGRQHFLTRRGLTELQRVVIINQ